MICSKYNNNTSTESQTRCFLRFAVSDVRSVEFPDTWLMMSFSQITVVNSTVNNKTAPFNFRNKFAKPCDIEVISGLHRFTAFSLLHQFAPWGESANRTLAKCSLEILLPGAKWPRNFHSLELSFPVSPWHWFATLSMTVLRAVPIF